MNEKFQTGVRYNHQMGRLETWSFLGEGVGAALYIISIATGQLPIAILGIAFVLGAVVVLRAHLGQPNRGWRALSRLRTSWVSRGTLVIAAFVGLSSLSVAAAYIGFLAPFRADLTMAALIFSVPVVIYAGMLLRSMKAVKLWHSPLLPLAFSAHSLASALTLAWALTPWLFPDPAAVGWLRSGATGCLLLAAALSAAHLLSLRPTAAIQASRQRLLAADLSGTFLWAAGAVGIAIPAVALLAAGWLAAIAGREAAIALLAVAAIGRIYGDYSYRAAIVRAGGYEPIFPPAANRSFPSHPEGKATVRAS